MKKQAADPRQTPHRRGLGGAADGALSCPADNAVRAVLLLITVTALIRIVIAGQLGLSVDESYAVAISRQLALSYLDHPPLHLWLVRAWARLLGSEQPLAVRLPDILLFAASTWLMYRLTASLYGDRAGWWAALALNLAPLFTLNTAIGVLPDGPLILCSLLAVWCFTLALAIGRGTSGSASAPAAASAPAPASIHYMLAAGAATGLALLSKYMAVFPLLALTLYVLSSRRHLLATPGPWLALLLTLILFTPVLLWNHRHGWASFAFQGGRARPNGLSLGRAAIDFGGQLFYLLPWTGLALLSSLASAVRRRARDGAARLLGLLAVPPIAAFALAGLWTTVLPHWPAIGWLFAFPLLGDQLAAIESREPAVPRRAAAVTAGVLICVVTLITTQAADGWMSRLVPALAGNDPTLDFLDWRQLRSAIGPASARPPMLIATVSWIDAGKADYALAGANPVICLSRDARQFAFMHDLPSLAGRDALIVATASRSDWLKLARPYFRSVEPLPDVQLTRGGEPAMALHTAYGRDLEPPPRTASASTAVEEGGNR